MSRNGLHLPEIRRTTVGDVRDNNGSRGDRLLPTAAPGPERKGSPMTLRSCPNCRAQVPSEADRCAGCGASIGRDDSTATTPAADAGQAGHHAKSLFVLTGDTVLLDGTRSVPLSDIRALEKQSRSFDADNYWQYWFAFVGLLVALLGVNGFARGVVGFGVRPLWIEFATTPLQALAIIACGGAVIYAALRRREKATHYHHLLVHLTSNDTVALRADSAEALEELHQRASVLLGAAAAGSAGANASPPKP